MNTKLPRVIAMVGPTATGKSDLAVELALRYDGEVVSADSRQVYKGLDIATGKITLAEMRGVPHHMLDIADPMETYTVIRYRDDARRIIHDILSRGKLPILCGGTWPYMEAALYDTKIPDVPINESFRAQLESRDTQSLFQELQEKDPRRAETIDPNNKRRLVRALEIIEAIGVVPETEMPSPLFDITFIGCHIPNTEAYRARLRARIDSRIQVGMLEEAESLHREGLTLERMKSLGLEYGRLAEWIEQGAQRDDETIEKFSRQLEIDIWHYSRRQMTWLKRNEAVHWVESFSPEIFDALLQ